ncbi:hypothetical protein [Paraliomyxa miuraensis]|uniref:hypothetical protein n=1 Tax=Paraliomyxa miuraensis TaxID=376150 RepID=UPI00225A4561|nr:hypothetical protein [Paraliomyxa miuraensis]MCX4244423.1 hypothetical protein [Paraliomyxa miuraensis]
MAAVLLALLDAHPDGAAWARPWLTQTLRANLPGYDDALGDLTLRGWSVGAAWGNETLVQSRPIVRNRDVDPIDDLLRTPASCVVAAFSVHSAAREGLVATPTPALSRYRRWLGVRVGTPLPANRASGLRQALPGFLERHQVDRSDGELVFLSFLAKLHDMGGLRKTYSPPEIIRQALQAAVDELGVEPPHNVMVSDGRTFAMAHHGGALLSFEPAPDAGPARFRVTGSATSGPRTNLLLHTPQAPVQAPMQGGERVGEGVLSIDVRTPRAIER